MRIRSLIVAIAVVLAGLVLASPAQAYPSMLQGVQGPYTVLKVVDGDTIHVSANGQKLKIRMIGLDTPETVDPRKPVQCFGLEASAQAKTILCGEAMTTAEMANYAYDQIDQARAELNAVSK